MITALLLVLAQTAAATPAPESVPTKPEEPPEAPPTIEDVKRKLLADRMPKKG